MSVHILLLHLGLLLLSLSKAEDLITVHIVVTNYEVKSVVFNIQV